MPTPDNTGQEHPRVSFTSREVSFVIALAAQVSLDADLPVHVRVAILKAVAFQRGGHRHFIVVPEERVPDGVFTFTQGDIQALVALVAHVRLTGEITNEVRQVVLKAAASQGGSQPGFTVRD